ncbi:MAG: cytochrome ubiquinol oxidase subunit I, partial [Caldimonas sp.]
QKIAAMEAIWETERGAALRLFAWPSESERRNRFEIAVPALGSWILTHSADGEIRGLNAFRGDHPPVAPVFFAFHTMVGIGVLMLLSAWIGVWLYRRARWDAARLPRRFLQLLAAMTFAGWLATVCGWFVTEIGRQPYLVFGLLRTADLASTVSAPLIAVTLALYVTLYVALVIAYVAVLKYMAEKSEDVLAAEAKERAAAEPGVATSPSSATGSAA